MFTKNCYAKVWDVKVSDRGTKTCRVSTSTKQQDGTYKQDFSGFITLCKDAKTLDVKKDDTLIIRDFGLTSSYNKEKDVEYRNILVWEAEIAPKKAKDGDATPTETTPASDDGFVSIPDDIGDELPFD